MSRYRGPRVRVCRRLGDLPGLTRQKSKKNTLPGEHGEINNKPSEYALRLEEKQKLKFNYGVNERQLLRYIKKSKTLQGSTGQVLLQLLEMRLDNTIFRLTMAPTIPAARQLITHGHIYVNKKAISIPSYQCKPGDIIQIKNQVNSQKLVEQYLQFPGLTNIPSHLELDTQNFMGKVHSLIEREWVALQLNELLVVEYYSRK